MNTGRADDTQRQVEDLKLQLAREKDAHTATSKREALLSVTVTGLESTLDRIAKIEAHRGMNPDEAVERLMAAVHYAKHPSY